MPIEQRWVNSGPVRLHYLEQESDAPLTPFLIVPGTFGVAEDYVQEMEALAPRRCITVSLRGRGQSDAPQSGYRFEDHVADITAAAAELGREKFIVMGYSMGAAYALGFAAQQPDRIADLSWATTRHATALSPPNGPSEQSRACRIAPFPKWRRRSNASRPKFCCGTVSVRSIVQ